MILIPIKTDPITVGNISIGKLLDRYVADLQEGSILVVTSKIVSICEGNVRKIGTVEKEELIHEQADLYLPRSSSHYNYLLTIKNNILIPTAGIDESNGNGYYILWPKDPQKNANSIREHLVRKFGLKKFGVIITDSKTTPLRWGTTGVALAHSGFAALNDLIGAPDIFGVRMGATKVNVADGLAAAAVAVMGESNEQTPLAVISDIPFVKFQPRNPTKKELADLKIDIEDDLYAPLLTSVKWHKGG